MEKKHKQRLVSLKYICNEKQEAARGFQANKRSIYFQHDFTDFIVIRCRLVKMEDCGNI